MNDDTLSWLEDAIKIELQRITNPDDLSQRKEVYTDIVKVCMDGAKRSSRRSNAPEFEKYIATGKRFVTGTGSYPLLHDLMATETFYQPAQKSYQDAILALLDEIEDLSHSIENGRYTRSIEREFLVKALGKLDRIKDYAYSGRLQIGKTALAMESELLEIYFGKELVF